MYSSIVPGVRGAALTAARLLALALVTMGLALVVAFSAPAAARAALPTVGLGSAEVAPPALFDHASFTDPSDPLLAVSGQARVVPPALQLVQRTGSSFSGSAWYVPKVDVSAGWQTRFAWRLSSNAGESPEGFAFVIQDDSTTARGSAGPNLGFADIPRSLAVAIGTTSHPNLHEPPAPFISVQTRGVQPNSSDFASSIASATASGLTDGRQHTITVRYVPPAGTTNGGLSIYLDDAPIPIVTVPGLDLADKLGLAGGLAWVGFTASTGSPPNLETAEIDSWSLGPSATPTSLAITSAPVVGAASAQPTLGPVAVVLEDAEGNRVMAPAALTIGLTSSSSDGVFASGLGVPPGTAVTILPGWSSTVFYYGDERAGTPTITAAADGLASAIHQETVVPGPRASITLSPASASIAAGEGQTYAVEAFDAFGNDRGPDDNADLAISPDGSCSGEVCTATAAGAHTVWASDAGLTTSASLAVRPGSTDYLVLSPGSASIAAGLSQTYTVEAFDAHDNRVSNPDVTLSIAPDGSCSGNVCTATGAGPHTVKATAGEVTASADLMVRPGPAASLSLSPASASIAAGVTQAYTVGASDAFGNPLPNPQVQLAIAPDGSCSGNVCTATVAGPHTVRATAGQLAASGALTVRPGPLASLGLSPASASIVVGDSQSYTVQASDAFGNPVSDPQIQLAIAPDGSCSASACTATVAGEHTVTASGGQITARATLTARALDTTAPGTAIALGPTGPDGNDGWYVSPVHVSVSADDGQDGSGVGEIRCVLDPQSAPSSYADLPSGCAYAGVGADLRADGRHVLYAAAKDKAGNAGTPVKQAFKLDTGAPTVTCPQAPTFLLDGPGAGVIATVADAVSGPAQEQVSAAADTSAVGAKTANVTGADIAGNHATATCAYGVRYAFVGFRAPIDNLDASGKPILNVVDAGRAIPLKWRLTDATGAPVTNLTGAQISVIGITCGSASTQDQVEEITAGASGLQSLGDGNYQLNWKSPTSYAGSCKRLRLDLGEGATADPIYHTADFKFGK